MKITGNKLLRVVVKWDYIDHSPSCWKKSHSRVTKKWSKKVRAYLKKELGNEILEYNVSTSPQLLTIKLKEKTYAELSGE